MRRALVLGATACLAACAGGMAGTGGGTATDVASEEEWRALRQPRPEPLPAAPRVTIGDVAFVGAFPWPVAHATPPSLGVAELAAAGLLRRRDVHFVERRRFAAAAEAERRGVRRRPGQPAAGVSPGAEFSANAVWLPIGDRAALEVRLVALETGDVAGATRVDLPANPDAVTLGRSLVTGIVQVLDNLGRRPEWIDPLDSASEATAATNAAAAAGVSPTALASFLRGLASEEAWDWEGARRGYLAASAEPGFHEARAALARAARLRLGGTLGEG